MLKNVLALFATLAISLVVGLVCYFIPTSGMSGVTSALSAGVMTYLLACPAASLLSCFVAYYHCQRAAGDESSAILGDESFLGYSDVDVMTFEDTEVFTEEDVNLKRLMLYGDRENMTKAMRQMASLFAAVGGPLNRVFSNSLDRKVQPAESVTVEECGVSGIVDGVGICAGNEEYMSRHGIVVPTSAEKSGGADTTKIMYAAENGQIYAKFDIRYSFSEEFTMIIPALKEKGIVPLIYTRDPNVNNELLAAITRDANTARVMKKLVDDPSENTVYRRASSGIVTTGDKLNALNMLLLAKKYADFKKRTTAMDYSAMAVGAVLAAIISFMGLSAVTAVIGVWHIAWCTVVGILSCKNFLKSKKKKETDNV
jgi:cation transport ATPase